MTEYYIALHPLSSKILETDHEQDGKIVIPISDPVSDLMKCSRSRNKMAIVKMTTVYANCDQVSPFCGYAIFSFHKRKCFDYMQAAIDHGKSALQAMKNWFAFYDIDTEYDEETMYREWLRYRKQGVIKPAAVHQKVDFTVQYADIDEIMSRTVAAHVELFYNTKHQFNKLLVSHMYIYTHNKIKNSFPKGYSIRSNYYKAAQWEAFMEQYPEVKKVYENLLYGT